jgi:2-hydroxychromene-2-carboxylate isomerase
MPISIKRLLLPAISRRMLSRERLLEQRASAERSRRARGERHEVHYFHQVDDPYSALLAAALPRLVARYDIDLLPHVVGPPADNAAPERGRLIAYSRKDAQLLARRWGLDFHDRGVQPPRAAVDLATGQLVAAIQVRRFVDVAGTVSARLWSGTADMVIGAALPSVDAGAVAPQRAAADALRQRLGHYLGATLFYGGEWYWGIDRLYHLELRLQDLGAQRPGVHDLLFPPGADLRDPHPIADPPPIDFFFSLRSPYSAIVAPRVFELGRLTGAPVRLRFVLPMVMRGLPVPPEKRAYIIRDAAREAFARGIPFGCLNDPVGRPTERGLALVPHAERAGKGPDYVMSFMRGVWAEGIDAGSDRGLRKIVERAGLSWREARQALHDEAWREVAERNRQQMFELGLWGVPSFRVRDTAAWGQDRLWAVEKALLSAGDGA